MKRRENSEQQYWVRFGADREEFLSAAMLWVTRKKEYRLLGLSRSDDRIIVFLHLRRTGYRLYHIKNYLKDIQDPKIHNFGDEIKRIASFLPSSVSILDTLLAGFP